MPEKFRQTVNVHLLPELAGNADWRDAPVVVIDVLRATTTMIYALAAGALSIRPCLTVEQAMSLVGAGEQRDTVVLGGERGGVKIDGFDLGNSPAEYTAAQVAGKHIVMTTTNGTRALDICVQAKRIVIAGFVNLQAVARSLQHEPIIHIVCAGTRRQVSADDCLVAGALVERLMNLEPDRPVTLNDSGQLVHGMWRSVSLDDLGDGESGDDVKGRLADELSRTQGGLDLVQLGYQSDIKLACDIERFSLVPEFDKSSQRILLP